MVKSITNQTNDDQYNEIKEIRNQGCLMTLVILGRRTLPKHNISSVMNNMYNEIKENNESKGA